MATPSSNPLGTCKQLIDKINSEREKLESVEQENADLNTLGIILRQKFAKLELFKVNVKVFDNLFDVYNLYNRNLIDESLSSADINCKYYIIEIYPSNIIPFSIINKKWRIHVCIKNYKNNVNHTSRLKGESKNGPFYVAVPFDNSEEVSIVETSLLHPSGQDYWPIVKTDVTKVDISYHLKPFREIGKQRRNDKQSLVNNFSRLYSENLDEAKLYPPNVDYVLAHGCGDHSLLNVLLQNCYHRVEAQHLVSLTAEGEVLDMKLSTMDSNIMLQNDKNAKVLNISAPIAELNLIKKYFFKELKSEQLSIGKMWLLQVQYLKRRLRMEMNEHVLNVGTLKTIAQEFRDLCFKLPL